MPKNVGNNIEYEIERHINSIINKKLKGFEKSLNKMMLQSLNAAHNRRVNDFGKSLLEEPAKLFNQSANQQIGKLATFINKSILKDF